MFWAVDSFCPRFAFCLSCFEIEEMGSGHVLRSHESSVVKQVSDVGAERFAAALPKCDKLQRPQSSLAKPREPREPNTP